MCVDIGTAFQIISGVATVGQMFMGNQQQQVVYEDRKQINKVKEEVASENLMDTYDQNFTKLVRHIEDKSGAKQDVEFTTRKTASTIATKQGERGAYSARLQRQPYVDQAFRNFQLDQQLARDLEDYEYSQSQAGRDYQSTVLGFDRPVKPSNTDLAFGITGVLAEKGTKVYARWKDKNPPKTKTA